MLMLLRICSETYSKPWFDDTFSGDPIYGSRSHHVPPLTIARHLGTPTRTPSNSVCNLTSRNIQLQTLSKFPKDLKRTCTQTRWVDRVMENQKFSSSKQGVCVHQMVVWSVQTWLENHGKPKPGMIA